MKKYTRILAAVDFSRHTSLVIEHAISLARELKAEIVFVNVLNQKYIDAIEEITEKDPMTNIRISAEEYLEGVYVERKNKMKKLLKIIDLGEISTRFITKSGVPFKALLEAVTDEAADLVLMGVKGRTDLADVIIGSTALKMFRRCPVPLISVREADV